MMNDDDNGGCGVGLPGPASWLRASDRLEAGHGVAIILIEPMVTRSEIELLLTLHLHAD